MTRDEQQLAKQTPQENFIQMQRFILQGSSRALRIAEKIRTYLEQFEIKA